MLARQGEELPGGCGAGFTQRFEQPFNHTTQQFIGDKVQWRAG
jgi:hypothetical protein